MVDVVRVGAEEDADMVVVAVAAPGGVVLPPDGVVVMEDIMLLKLPLCETGQVSLYVFYSLDIKSKGGGGSWKSGHSKGGCGNFIV